MARIRTIKPSIWTDEAFVSMSRDARLLTLGMISQGDDDGRLPASPASLIGALYPYDDLSPKQVEKWRGEVQESGLFVVYGNGRAVYGAFPKWHKHQVINRYTASRLPEPEGIECVSRSGKTHGGTQ